MGAPAVKRAAGLAAAAPAATHATPLPTAGLAPRARPSAQTDHPGSLRILTCGSVDDGKSTLIGRLLWDASDLFDDQRKTIERSSRTSGDGANPDFSLLVDGLAAEREQGITIDIAWRYFDTDTRRIVIIDSPGHEQYTRNMATGASHADVALMLVDARSGIKRQTRRHAAILDLVGVKRVILVVNKMDLVDWSQARFEAIAADFRALVRRFGFGDAIAVPVSSPSGDNVAHASRRMPWYDGPTLLDILNEVPSRISSAHGPFRMPVQIVLRDGRDFRGLAGTITSGSVRVGDAVHDLISGQTAKVARIVTMDRDLKSASIGQAVTIQLDRDLDIARGAVLALPTAPPIAALEIEARIVWMSEAPFDPAAGYLLRTSTDVVPISGFEIEARLDLETLVVEPSEACAVNDIADARLVLGRAVAVDVFRDMGATGTVLIVDAITGATVAGGVVLAASRTDLRSKSSVFTLTRDQLARGVCRDLGDSDSDREEFKRRAGEIAILMRQAGVIVRLDL